MSAPRCPTCDAPLTEAEALAGTCPECTAPLTGDPADPPIAEPVPARGTRRGWVAFPAGLAVGLLLASAGGYAAWRTWGPEPAGPVAEAADPAADRAALDEQVRQAAAAVQKARTALQQAEAQQAEVDRELAAARAELKSAHDRTAAELKSGKDRVAALDTELAARTARLADLDRSVEARRARLADLERALAAARAPRPPAPAERAPAGLNAAPPPVPPPVPAPRSKGAFARDWLLIGPFPDPNRKGHTNPLPPESGRVDPKREYPAAAGPVKWRAHASPANYVDLAEALKTRDPGVGYAVCWVRGSRARKVVLSLGSAGGLKVWVNGKLIADRPGSGPAEPGRHRATCDLRDGWNEVRVKVTGPGGPWGFYLEARDATTDRPLAGLEYRTTPPASK